MKVLLLIGALCVTAPAFADDSASLQARPAKEKKMCRLENVIGQVIPARICLTRTEWAELDKHYETVDQSFIERRKDHFNAIQGKPVDPQ